MKLAAAFFLALFAACACLAPGAWAAAAPSAEAQKAENPPAPEQPAPVPLADVAAQADAVTVRVRRIAQEPRVQDELDAIGREVPALARQIDAHGRESSSILARRPSLDLLRNLDGRWQQLRQALAGRAQRLKDVVSRLDRDLESLDALDKTWKATLAAEQEQQAPAELLRRTQSLLAEIRAAREDLTAQRAAALKVQARISDLTLRVTEGMQANREARDATIERMFVRDSAPLWQSGWRENTAERISTSATAAFERQWTILRIYMEPRLAGSVALLALFGALVAVFVWARRRLTHFVVREPGLRRAATVVEHPIASALVLALLLTPSIYQQAPRVLSALSGVALLVPTIVVLRRLVAVQLLAPLYAVLAFFFVDQLRAVSASIDVVPRLLFVAEMTAAAAFLLWFARRARSQASPHPSARRARLAIAATIVAALCAATALANVLGYVALSNLVGNAVLDSMYAGLVLYAVLQLLDALVLMALRVRPLKSLTMVHTHGALLQWRAQIVLRWAAAAIWIVYVLDRLALRDSTFEQLRALLGWQLRLGEIRISLSAIVSFVIAVWAAFLVSRLVRFVLNEEVFPRTHLGRGIPYAITRTIHFLIIALGFFVAMGVIGMEMTQFTILASAFTIGVGFGLQNIFNNFVSGLIVLFERPVQVGDVIQIDADIGVVERIGIRATVVRTANRSEIIVPNGKLISDRVINWTLSERQRMVEVQLSVVLQSDPAQVIAVLEEVAKNHPAVLKTPPAQAILTRMGPDWMGFELRAAIAEVEAWMTIRSELGVAVVAALRAAGVNLR